MPRVLCSVIINVILNLYAVRLILIQSSIVVVSLLLAESFLHRHHHPKWELFDIHRIFTLPTINRVHQIITIIVDILYVVIIVDISV